MSNEFNSMFGSGKCNRFDIILYHLRQTHNKEFPGQYLFAYWGMSNKYNLFSFANTINLHIKII